MYTENYTDIITLFRDEIKYSGLLSDMRETNSDIMVTCPFHKNGKEKKPSCGISKDTGVYHCFTCGASGTLEDFIGKCLNGSFIDGHKWIQQNFDEVGIDERKVDIDFNRKSIPHDIKTYVPEMVLDQYRYIHPYMYQRKMNDMVIELFDIGYDKETDCLTFPVRDISGKCLFVARRSIKDKWYSYPKGAEKPLYGLFEAYREYPNDTELFVTESMINCVTLWKYGIPAVALNGTGSKEQYDRLCNVKYRTLVLCLDPDNAGRSGMEKIKNYCKNKIIKTVNYKDSRDINDLEHYEVQELLDTKHLW